MASEVWVYADFHDTKNLSLIGKAQSLARACGGKAAAVCTVTPPSDALLISSGADIVYHLRATGSDIILSHALCKLCESYCPDILLFPASIEYGAVAARTAAQLHTGLTADCTGLAIDENGLLRQTRPALGGGLIADIYCQDRRPQMATVQTSIFPIPEPDLKRTGICITYSPSVLFSDPVELIIREKIPAKKDLREGHIIVAGGKGIGSREGFDFLSMLAERIGGLFGASRSAVDAGYADYDRQIGQTGISVSPNLYLAFGISGAPQHIAGMNTSRKVIAVNCDPKAQIFDYADLAIVGDWQETVEAILKAL